jgi:hypothetical protein
MPDPTSLSPATSLNALWNPRFLTKTAPHDMAIIICQMLYLPLPAT